MSDLTLRSFHLIAARKLLGLTQVEMALALYLTPFELIDAEGEVQKGPLSLMTPLSETVETKLLAFLEVHPVARSVLGSGTASRLPSAA